MQVVMEKRKSVYQSDKRRIMRNVLLISLAWVFLFTSFQSLSQHQSSINAEKGLGTVGLAVLYGCLVISCMTIPPAMISRLGCKWTIAVSMVGYIIYTGANFYASLYTIIPSSVVVGFAAAPLWAAKCTYLTEASVAYALMNREESDDVISRFFGIFFGFFQTSQVWGNLATSTILLSGTSKDNYTDDVKHCGIFHCNDLNITNLKRPDDVKIYTFMSVYVVFSVVALILILFLDNMNHDDSEFDPRTLLSTVMQMKNKYQLLLIPITIYSGLEQGYMTSEFTKAYLSCTLGIWIVGYVMICYGICDALGSYLSGKVYEYIGRIPLFIIAAIIHSCCIIGLIMWQPRPEPTQQPIFFVIAGFWGIADSIWQTQINAFYGAVFPKNKEAAFGNYRLWESMGFIIAFGYSSFLCVRVKTYITWLVLVIAMMCYGVTEFLLRREERTEKHESYHMDTNTESANPDFSPF